MSIEITFGWWLLPAFITVFGFIYADNYKPYRGGDYSFDFEGIARIAIWLIVTLFSWLIWALL